MIFIIYQNINSEYYGCSRRRQRLYKLYERLHSEPRNCVRLCMRLMVYRHSRRPDARSASNDGQPRLPDG